MIIQLTILMQTTSDKKGREFSVTLKEKSSGATQTEILHRARVIFDVL